MTNLNEEMIKKCMMNSELLGKIKFFDGMEL